jgi:mannose-6-phosphate isomerase-like protein (cupin superfamily)
MISSLDLKNKMEEIKGKHCSPIDIARVNDHVIRMAFVNGEYHWHKHKEQDELFYLLKGKLMIQIKGQEDIILSEGQISVIPKGVEHCPKSIEPSYVVLFESFDLKSMGD